MAKWWPCPECCEPHGSSSGSLPGCCVWCADIQPETCNSCQMVVRLCGLFPGKPPRDFDCSQLVNTEYVLDLWSFCDNQDQVSYDTGPFYVGCDGEKQGILFEWWRPGEAIDCFQNPSVCYWSLRQCDELPWVSIFLSRVSSGYSDLQVKFTFDPGNWRNNVSLHYSGYLRKADGSGDLATCCDCGILPGYGFGGCSSDDTQPCLPCDPDQCGTYGDVWLHCCPALIYPPDTDCSAAECDCQDMPDEPTCCGGHAPTTQHAAITGVDACVCPCGPALDPSNLLLQYVGTGALPICNSAPAPAGPMKWVVPGVYGGTIFLLAFCRTDDILLTLNVYCCCEPGGLVTWQASWGGTAPLGSCRFDGIVLSGGVSTLAGCPAPGSTVTLTL